MLAYENVRPGVFIMARSDIAAAVFHVGHHDDRNDAAERASDDSDFRRGNAQSAATRASVCSDVDLRCGLCRHLVRV